ncbi:MAG: flagellar type III secretion system pore protein FliP, partial [Planctomycetes bacterium]|nr:flagellar type III secretion system pore protein FliP [Planctomycetota bacterium]
ILLLMTVLTLLPAGLIMMTAFTRIIVVFGFLRMALATQQVPPTQVLTGLALILTFMVMRPTFTNIKDKALVPYLDAEITQSEAFDRSLGELRTFMFKQVAEQDLIEFGYMAGEEPPKWQTEDDVDTLILVPAFVTSELKRGFYMGFMLYLPFLVIDLIVSTVLISMGMLVLPPVLISMPFKLLLFVLVDGWTLVVRSLFQSFNPIGPDGGGG